MKNSKPYVIAEIGVNFYDTAKEENILPIEAARLYIDKAYEAGIDCVKFQSYKADKIASVFSPAYWDTTKEPTTSQYELFRKFDSFGEQEYKELSDYAHKLGMDFTSTPFDFEAADYLEDMIDFYKISSSDINNTSFIRHIAGKGKPVYISTGASYLSEIEQALRVVREVGCVDVCLMHCVLSYPTKPDDANLNMIKTLSRCFPDVRIGYSDHVAPDESMYTLTTAYMLGAEVIEKHFTLDKTFVGNDHYHAADPMDFKKAIDGFRYIDTLRGSERKTILKCEEVSRKQARRSLVAKRDIRLGEVIDEDMIAFKRPGTGISPKDVDIVIGRKAICDIEKDVVLTWDMV